MTSLMNMYCKVKSRLDIRDEAGQSTAEYSLVILGAAAIAMLLYGWASGTGSIGNLFDSVVARVTSKAP